MVKEKVLLQGLHCSNCAQKIEDKLISSKKFDELFVNFANSTLYIENTSELTEEEKLYIQSVLDAVEPGTQAVFAGETAAQTQVAEPRRSTCEDGSCDCGHDHAQEHNHDETHEHNHGGDSCGCVHDHTQEHNHGETHEHNHEDDSCGCGHDHAQEHTHGETHEHNHEGDSCDCGHDHAQENTHGETHEHNHEGDSCDCGHDHTHDHTHGKPTDSTCEDGSCEIHPVTDTREMAVNPLAKTKQKLLLEGLHCSNCAQKIETALQKSPVYKNVFVNFASSTLYLEKDTAFGEEDLKSIQKTVDDIEPGTVVKLIAEETSAAVSTNTPPMAATKAKKIKTSADNEEKPFLTLDLNQSLFALSVFGFILSFFVPEFAVPYLIAAVCLLANYDVFYKGITGIPKLRIDENLLMTIAVAGSFAIGEFAEGAMVALLFKMGLILEERAVNASRRSIAALTDIQAEEANVLRNGNFVTIEAKDVQLNDILRIRPGEKVPVDCIITKGATTVDAHALTGESVPVNAVQGDTLQSGSINLTGALEAKATNTFHNSTASRIIELVELSAAKKSNTQNFITRFARIYTPIVLVLAALVAFLPPAIGMGTLDSWVYKALIFIVSACPCALVIATPLGFFSGVGAASKKGVLIKGSKYLEALSQADTFVLDKTGTITSGDLNVSEIFVAKEPYTEDSLLQLTASIQQFSTHPIAKAIVADYKGELLQNVENFQDVVGMGVVATVDGKQILCGSMKLMDKYNVNIGEDVDANIIIAADNEYIGFIRVSDQVKESSITATKQLKDLGAKQIIMLTGDGKYAAQQAMNQCSYIDNSFYSLLPQDKVDKLEEIKKTAQKTVFVGDGINDAPVLASSDVGVAMGFGTDAAIEAADVVLMSESLVPLAQAVKVSKDTMGIIRFNIWFALLTKALVVTLGLFGLATTWMAVFADVGVTILSVLNTSRILRK